MVTRVSKYQRRTKGTEIPHPERLRSVVQQFLRLSQVVCDTPEQSFERCYNISDRLKAYLLKRGIDARVVTGVNFEFEPEDDAHPKLIKLYEKEKRNTKPGKWPLFWNHGVVLVGDTVVDLTGAQFGQKYGEQVIYPLSKFKKNWKNVFVGEGLGYEPID